MRIAAYASGTGPASHAACGGSADFGSARKEVSVKEPKQILSRPALLFLLLMTLVCMAACGKQEQDPEDMAERMTETAEETNGGNSTARESSDILDDAGNVVEHAAEDTGDAVKDVIDGAGNVIKDAADGISDTVKDMAGQP